ncbi:Protein of unknown function [Gryllus bimaculatus]|nr:Protein of unknown function [Gryllus bimaculatus]
MEASAEALRRHCLLRSAGGAGRGDVTRCASGRGRAAVPPDSSADWRLGAAPRRVEAVRTHLRALPRHWLDVRLAAAAKLSDARAGCAAVACSLFGSAEGKNDSRNCFSGLNRRRVAQSLFGGVHRFPPQLQREVLAEPSNRPAHLGGSSTRAVRNRPVQLSGQNYSMATDQLETSDPRHLFNRQAFGF